MICPDSPPPRQQKKPQRSYPLRLQCVCEYLVFNGRNTSEHIKCNTAECLCQCQKTVKKCQIIFNSMISFPQICYNKTCFHNNTIYKETASMSDNINASSQNELPFYKKDSNSDIDNIRNIILLLQATPFKRDTSINFSKRLTDSIFFNELYTDMWLPANNEEICRKNREFDQHIQNDLVSMENPDERISLLHLWGYAGTGKTTYIRHLLWDLSNKQQLSYNVINFEKCSRVSEALATKVSRLIGTNNESIVNYLSKLTNNDYFNMEPFGIVFPFLKSFALRMRDLIEIGANEPADTLQILQNIKEIIERQIKETTIDFENLNDDVTPYSVYIDFLLSLLFFISIYKTEVQPDKSSKTVILFDNVDSMRNLKEEYVLLTSIMNFLNASHLFFDYNADNEHIIKNKKISDILSNMKYSIFLTTRVVTAKRFRELKPDLEDSLGQANHEMPEQFYNHRQILYNRLAYYQKAENYRTDSQVLNQIKDIYELSTYVYRSSSFHKLFNGNIRFCFRTLIYLYNRFYTTPLYDDCKRLNQEYDRDNAFAGIGANGIVLSMVLDYFKSNGVYSKKLHLSECSQDNNISLSRIILTILHENEGRCSVLEIFDSLPPEYVNEQLCEYIYDLSERERDVWRRLITFERRIPETEAELERQCVKYKNNDKRRDVYTDLLLCRGGEVFLDIVIPHFEFMLSRCSNHADYLCNEAYYPLFSHHSLNFTYTSNGELRYNFENKINKVYSAVKECSTNSKFFANRVMDYFSYDNIAFIKDSKLNYHEDDESGMERSHQSYISRLVFSHVGYIECYRFYLKKINQLDANINKKLTLIIEKYLNIYAYADPCLRSPGQDMVLNDLLGKIRKIRRSNFTDYNTRIATTAIGNKTGRRKLI